MITVRSSRGSRGQRWLRELEHAFNRSGAIAGEVYALAARGILSRIERLEDRAAERRFRHRTPSQRTQAQPAPPSPE